MAAMTSILSFEELQCQLIAVTQSIVESHGGDDLDLIL
jgi:hypothetical protein